MPQIAISAILTLIVWKLSKEHRTRNLAWLAILGYVGIIATSCAVNPAQVVTEIATIISGIIPIVGAAASVIDPAASAEINAGVTLITGGLAALEKLVSGYQHNPSDTALQEIQAAFTDVQNNLTQLESAAQIKDPTTQKKIAAIIQSAVLSLAALESSITANHPAAVAVATTTPKS